MRPQKAQLPSFYNWSQTWTTWYSQIHAHAGYRNYEVLIVGSGGGPSGKASGLSNAGKTITAYASGGGGGGSRKVAGLLADLPNAMGVLAGLVGAPGADVGLTGTAGTGADGSVSVFGPDFSASGGRGGVGGYVRANGDISQAIGGDGGVGNAGGTAGDGQEEGSTKDGQGVGVSGGFSGGGGGGGWGRITGNSGSLATPTAGGDGVQNRPTSAAPGISPTTNKGGGGGGCQFVLGSYDGGVRGSATAVSPECDGGVILSLS